MCIYHRILKLSSIFVRCVPIILNKLAVYQFFYNSKRGALNKNKVGKHWVRLYILCIDYMYIYLKLFTVNFGMSCLNESSTITFNIMVTYSGRFAYSSQTRPCYKFTDPALARSASSIKDRLLNWVKAQTKEYKVYIFVVFVNQVRPHIHNYSA